MRSDVVSSLTYPLKAMVFFSFVMANLKGNAIGFGCSGIEDLAIAIRYSRESDKGGRRCCIEHDFSKRFKG